MATLDILTFVLSMVYIFLAIRNNYWCFIVAIAQCSLWAYLDFFRYSLVFDGVLQIFYIFMAIWGIYNWTTRKNEKEMAISSMALKYHVGFIFSAIILSIFLAYGSTFLTVAKMPYLDSFTTTLSIGATFLLVFRKIGNWIYFIVADLLYIYIYYRAGSTPLAIVMGVYSVMAVIGYFQWQKHLTSPS